MWCLGADWPKRPLCKSAWELARELEDFTENCFSELLPSVKGGEGRECLCCRKLLIVAYACCSEDVRVAQLRHFKPAFEGGIFSYSEVSFLV